MITRRTGHANIFPYKKAASETFALNDVVTKNTSGYLTKATSSTPRAEILGLIQRAVLSTDTDYASNTLVEVDVPESCDEFEFDVSTGTAVQAYVGQFFDIEDNNSLNASGTGRSTGLVEITRILSTTLVRGKFHLPKRTGRLVTYTQAVALADFTDGGGATGSLALGVTIPAGAVYLQTIVTDIVGFAGDTTATLQVGDTGGDVDRYSTGTPSVFTTAAAGVDMGVPSGTKWHTAAVVPDLLITAGSDWGLVTAGSLIVTLMWLEGK